MWGGCESREKRHFWTRIEQSYGPSQQSYLPAYNRPASTTRHQFSFLDLPHTPPCKITSAQLLQPGQRRSERRPRPQCSTQRTDSLPPLHHPVPQHVSTVPQLRSPPPPVPQPQPQQQQPQGYGSPYPPQGAAAQAGNNVFGQYGNFVNDPAAQLASQFGQSAFKHGQEYFEQNVNRYVNLSALKHYFNVTNSYVINKLFLVLFPWRHKPWSRKQTMGPNGQDAWYFPPRDDINSPDMYIPVMSLVTYILLSTLVAGLRGKFQPELLGYTASKALVVVVIELTGLKLGCYLLSISNESQILDLVAYSGYKFVGIIATISISGVVNGGKGTGGWIGWTVFLYTFLANALFLMRSLKYVLLPESGGDGMQMGDSRARPSQKTRNQRTQFLFFYSYIVQLFLMWILSRQ